jgi:drug/metabolite transporter (DMT)-like permease
LNKTSKAYLQIHFAVVLFGLTAILGKLIVMPEGPLVWHRLWISVVGLIVMPGVIIGIVKMGWKMVLRYAGIGGIVAIHWLTFYGSIKLGNSVSITLACFATTTLFTAILEPIITKSKFRWEELILGIFAVVGIYMVASVGKLYAWAIIVGLISAFLAALFSSLNKRYISDENILSVSTVELAAGWVVIGLLLPLYPNFSISDLFDFGGLGASSDASGQLFFGYKIHSFWYLIVLGLLCTSLAFVLQLKALRYLKAFTTNLVINLEPIYGILLAVWIFEENKDLNTQFYLGTTIILASVALYPFVVRWVNKRSKLPENH